MNFDSDDIVLQLFKKHLEERGFTISEIDQEEIVHISNGNGDFKVSLYNLRKDYARDESQEKIINFVNAIVADDEFPAWEEAKTNIYPSLYPADFEYHDFINFPITETFNMIIVYEKDGRKVWISESQLEEWAIDNQLIVQIAYENIDKILYKADLKVNLIEDKKLCYFELDDETMKAVLLIAKGLKNKVLKEIGWPICAVIPVRDFCYLFSADDLEFFAERLGDTVIEEYQQSGYPITTEIIECSDGGINAIGNYEKNE